MRNEIVVNQLFSQSEGIFYANEVVYTAEQGSTLLDLLEDAGAALADVL